MVLIPAGPFMMGCNPAVEPGGCDGEDHVFERPYHEVELDAFMIDRTEVTARAYRACLDAGRCPSYAACAAAGQAACPPARVFADDAPMHFVMWDQAVEYCRFRGKSLPTEAQWEKAARGTDGRLYPWGNQPPTCELANHWSTTRWSECGNGLGLRVGQRPAGASPYGVLDMAGGVPEWVTDWFTHDAYTTSARRNPTGPAASYPGFEGRVVRGGTHYDPPDVDELRVSHRTPRPPSASGIGFRCAKAIE